MQMIQSMLESLNMSQVAQLLEQGGFVVAILLCLSLLATTLIIIKGVQIFWYSIGAKASSQRAVSLWLEGHRKEAYYMVEKSGNPTKNALAHLMRGLQRSDINNDALREDVERVALKGLGEARRWKPLCKSRRCWACSARFWG